MEYCLKIDKAGTSSNDEYQSAKISMDASYFLAAAETEFLSSCVAAAC